MSLHEQYKAFQFVPVNSTVSSGLTVDTPFRARQKALGTRLPWRFSFARAIVSPAPPPTNHRPHPLGPRPLTIILFKMASEFVARSGPPARLIPQHNHCLWGMWIPLVDLPVFRTSLGRLVWGRRCSAAANGGRKYNQLLWSKLWAMWEHCYLQKAGRFVYWTRRRLVYLANSPLSFEIRSLVPIDGKSVEDCCTLSTPPQDFNSIQIFEFQNAAKYEFHVSMALVLTRYISSQGFLCFLYSCIYVDTENRISIVNGVLSVLSHIMGRPWGLV